MPRTNAEALLLRARAAETPVLRAKYATVGLSQPRLQADTHVLLLRQLYLSHMERERYEEAKRIALQMVELGALGDVALHDVSRACLAVDDVRSAARYLLTASRSGPASRRAFHLSCLGSLYLNTGDATNAVRVLRRSVRWAAEERPLYRAQLALAQKRKGSPVDLAGAFAELKASRRNGGYAEFVLGELAQELGKTAFAKRKLLAFLARVECSSVSIRTGLRYEVERAKDLLARMSESESTPKP